MSEPFPPEGEVEGPTEPVPGGQPSGEPQPWMPLPGTYGSRNAGRRQSILEAFGQIAKMSDVDAAVGEVRDDVQNMGTVVQDYGTAIEELGMNRVMPWAVPTVSPLSQSINRRADPTFQLSDLMSPLLHGTDSRGDTVTVEPYQMQRGMNTKGRIYYSFITPAVTRAYTQLNFMVSEVVDPCRMDIAVYVVDPNRGLTRQVHQTDAAASLGFSESVVTVNFPTFVADQGSYLAIAFLQHGTGNARYILGLDDTPRPLLGSVFPPKISATNQQTGHTSLPTFIDGNNGTLVDFAGYWFTPYAELSEDVGIDYKMFTEGWGYPTGPVPRPWVALAGGGIYAMSGAANTGTGPNSGVRVSLYDTPLSTDHIRVRASVGNVNSAGNPRSTLVVRSSNDMRSGIGVSVIRGSHYELISWSNRDVGSSWGNRTVHATFGSAPIAGHMIEVDYLDGVVDVRVGGVQYVTELPVGGPVAAAGRFVGIQQERTLSGFAVHYSPHFGPWSARDLPQSGGGDEGEG